MSSAGPGDFGGILRIFYAFGWHSLDTFHHPRILPFVPVHSNNFQKIELFLGLTQLIMLELVFREDYLMEHLSVKARWNQNEEIFRMGC